MCFEKKGSDVKILNLLSSKLYKKSSSYLTENKLFCAKMKGIGEDRNVLYGFWYIPVLLGSNPNIPYGTRVALGLGLCKRLHYIRGLSGKYPAILNISKTGSMALM